MPANDIMIAAWFLQCELCTGGARERKYDCNIKKKEGTVRSCIAIAQDFLGDPLPPVRLSGYAFDPEC